MRVAPALLVAVSACALADAPTAPDVGPTPTGVSDERLRLADREPHNWLAHGRSQDEQRFSPLAGIDAANVAGMGLAWSFALPSDRAVEATPLVIDGVIYATLPWSVVVALDARSGRLLWSHDPRVDRSWSRYACCDVVNRGLAAWGERLYLGTLDGWLVALDARSGREVWRIDTIERRAPYTITGAPRVVGGRVIIGNGGAEYGVRGFVSAYDAETGRRLWRFHTVPGDPSRPFESPAMELAAKTWTGEWWRYGGGGTVWDSMAYDPALDLLYVGVGNGSPWNQRIRSPGGGDNLFLASIVALRPETGEYVWHYQTTPGETWDFTATQSIVLAELPLEGRMRRVLLQAPKNGFFYVLDRETGRLLSARNFVPVNWATHVDLATGRPVETPEARFYDRPESTFELRPMNMGGHNWHPMAFDPGRGLAFIPTWDIALDYRPDADFRFDPGFSSTGVDMSAYAAREGGNVLDRVRVALVAWDPVRQREAWRVALRAPAPGGTLATAGGLVFEGDAGGTFHAFRSSDGAALWSFAAASPIVAAPVSFAVDGEQHVAVMSRDRLMVFRLGASAALPAPATPAPRPPPEPPAQTAGAQEIAAGRRVFNQRCLFCHGVDAVGIGTAPDLRRSAAGTHAAWDAIVRDGARQALGMPGFGGLLRQDEIDSVHAYVIERARELAGGR